MSDNTLTDRQQEIYDFLRHLILRRGYGPTVREIGSHFGIRSPKGVMCHLKALEKKGKITRETRMSRAISLVGFNPNKHVNPLPVVGTIAAGLPTLAEEVTEEADFSSMFAEGNYTLEVADEEGVQEAERREIGSVAIGDLVFFDKHHKPIGIVRKYKVTV